MIYGKTRGEVRDQLLVAQREAQQGITPTPERLTVGLFLEDWLARTRTTIRPATVSSYSDIVRLHLVPELGATLLARLQPAQVDALLRSRTAAGLSPRRVAYIRAILRRALGQAVKWGVVGRNVAVMVDPPPGASRNRATIAR